MPLLVPMLIAAASAAATPTLSPIDTLVAAERQFAAMSVEKGVRDAFVEFLDDSAIVFRPLPVYGRPAWQARGPVAGMLSWGPTYAEISGAADLGVSSGPWQFQPPAEVKDATTVYGHFNSVWARPPGGDWRVVLDIGVSHEKPQGGLADENLTRGPLHVEGKRRAGKKSADELRSMDATLSREAQKKGLRKAFIAVSAQDLRFCRDGFIPTVGIDYAYGALPDRRTDARWIPDGARVALSDDLGYSYGLRLERPPGRTAAVADTSVYLHVWRREGSKWKLSLAVENPVPKAAP